MKFFISVHVHSMPLCMKLNFFLMATTGTLAKVHRLNPLFTGFKHKLFDIAAILRSILVRSSSTIAASALASICSCKDLG